MSDVEGIVERLREMGEFFGPNIPTRPVREKLSAVDARHCDEASALMLEGADEIARLNAALQYEQDRSGRIGTHGVGCWAWGPQHYECALSELQSRDATIARLEGEAAQWKADSADEFLKRQKAEAALSEAVKVVEQIGRMRLFPDHAINQTTLVAAINLARTFLSKQEGGK